MFTTKLRGEHPGEPWTAAESRPSGDWVFRTAADDPPERLYALWDAAVQRSRDRLRAALADGGLGQLVDLATPDGQHASLRRLVCDLIEEYGRHTGHADLLREAIDGRVGEDPPRDWTPSRPRAAQAGLSDHAIFHITERSLWEQALAAGSYEWSTRGAPLSEVGFIHCSFGRQV